jgi:hypothetical protein
MARREGAQVEERDRHRHVFASLVLAGIGTILTVSLAGPVNAEGSVPYQDPAAVGSIGFCDKDGQPVTSGNVNEQPPFSIAVSSEAAPAGYEKGAAALLAYQPRKDVPPGEWSGELLTSGSIFTDPDHPMAKFTNADQPLIAFVSGYPPQVDGLIQLRMYFNDTNAELGNYSQTYPATNIRISGDTWSVVDGGPAACDAGSATSLEELTLPKSTFKSPKPSSGQSSGGTTSPNPADGSNGENAAAAGSAEGDGAGSGFVAAGLAAVAIIGGIAGLLYWRRSRAPSG